MKRFLIFGLLILALLAVSACRPNVKTKPTDAELSNPASAYCEEQGGTVEMRTDAQGGQYGVCIFEDQSECDEWAFYQGECKPGDFMVAPSPDANNE